MSHWVYKNEIFAPAKEEIITGDDIGFVYNIENRETGQAYIGKKMLISKRTRPPLKGRKNRRHYIAESDWRKYTSSCVELKEDIQRLGKDCFIFDILHFHKNKTELNYAELVVQVQLNVLQERLDNGLPKYYNRNIMQKFYPSEKFWDERMMLHEQNI